MDVIVAQYYALGFHLSPFNFSGSDYMNGKTFMRTLAKKGIPCSVFAAKTNSNINEIYELKHKNEIPQKYLLAARALGITNLPA